MPRGNRVKAGFCVEIAREKNKGTQLNPTAVLKQFISIKRKHFYFFEPEWE
jgi:hypothetical protein